MLDLSAYSASDLQHCRGVIADGQRNGLSLDQLAAALEAALPSVPPLTGKPRQRTAAPVCSVCGGPAVRVAVNTESGNLIGGPWTHAVQCQNRPAKDKPWLARHCGHTEYIVEGR